MTPRIQVELEMLRTLWPGLEFREEGLWVRIANYRLPSDIWTVQEIPVAFQIPENHPGQAPYAFYVHPLLALRSGQAIQNYGPAATPWGEWGKFSWTFENWQPADEIANGSNLVDWVRSFNTRLAAGA